MGRGKSVGLRLGSVNVGTMTGREPADRTQRRKLDVLCKQETGKEGSRAGKTGARFTLSYLGVERQME